MGRGVVTGARRLVALAAMSVAGPAWGDAMSRSPTDRTGQVTKVGEWTLSADGYVAINPTWWSVGASASYGFGKSVGEGRQWNLALGADVNDAYVTPALSLEWDVSPAFALALEYRGFGFYGVNGALLNFGSVDAPYGDEQIDALMGTPAETSGYGQRVALAAQVSVDVKPWVIAMQGATALYNLAPHPGAYLDWETDKLTKPVDGVVLLRAATLFVAHRTAAMDLVLGPYYEVNAALQTQLVRQRVGAIAGIRVGKVLRLGVAAGVNAMDPNRAGEGYAITDLGVDFEP